MQRPSREFILDEVRRCAADNNGVPLGRVKFQDATGIRESDWLGRYWVRWNDVLAEAGFSGNSMQSRVYDRTALVRHLALLTRDLGHFPTSAEQRLRARTDSTFPSHTRFYLRLGSRQEQIAAVVELAKADTDFTDVLDICLPLITESPAQPDSSDSTATGYVYLVRSGKHHKIGFSNNVGRRSYELALQLPERLTLIHVLETDDPPGIERYWHERFADRRVNGEWFLLRPEDVSAFKRRRKFM